MDTLPCSLVLIKTDTASVVGHARLMAVAGAPTEALVESGKYNHFLLLPNQTSL